MTASVRQRHGRFALVGISAMLVATTIVAGSAAPASAAVVTASYVPFGPARLADTRATPCGCDRVDGSTFTVEVGGRAGVPAGVIAAAITVTATPTRQAAFVSVYPDGTPRPEISTLNTRSDRTVANSAIVPVGANGRLAVYALAPGDVILDITGVFVATEAASAGRYVAVASRRLVDTRLPGADAGPLAEFGELTVPLPSGVPADATAVAVNVTSVGETLPSFLAARPAGSRPTTTSFVNMNGSGQAVAATTIAPVSAGGMTITSRSGGHVIVDLLGWFTGPSAARSSEGLFVPLGPQRLLDTRVTTPRAWPNGTVELAVQQAGAGSLVTNVTATYADRAGFVTAFPAGTPRPDTSTLNPAMFDHTLANLAITPISSRGLAYYARSGADIVVDVTGMFTGAPVAATEAAAPNAPSRSRVLIVGDSTLAALRVYPQSQAGLVGFEPIVDAASCRRLWRPSCLSATTNLTPNTAFEAILSTPGNLDIVVVKTGYNDWFSDFPLEFDAVVQAARAKGAHTILWLTYNDGWRPRAAQAYAENNVDLFHLVTLPQYSDVLLGDWRGYSNARAAADWTDDGHHLTPTGAWLLTDYVSRWIAAIEHRPCERPTTPGGPIATPCPPPDVTGPVPDPRALY